MRTISIALALCLSACGGSTSGEAAPEDDTASAEGEAPVAAEEEAVEPAAPELLAAGTAAPDFSLPDQSGETRTLAAERGNPVVLYFYPRDATPGCTVEACAFRDAWARYEEVGVRLFGVSTDDVDSHRAFADEHELPFPLLADTEGTLADSYGVAHDGGFARRVTFLIGPDGTVRHVFDRVDPAVHADEVLAQVAAMQNP